ncbi:MAG: hypothetical protein A2W25_08920 [candidate division Zixibacteria bacterium RBG_16_53_22]|nr:MAG: hypothetical protein A2W25_08920 [candidate division Zixibacteria bacterium RBG_16_53_22]
MKVDHHIIDRSSWDEINIDGWFKALIPPTWEVDDEDDVIIFDPEGFGELNITFLERTIGRSKRDVAGDIIAGWAEELDQYNGYEANIVKRSKEVLIVSAEFTADEPEGEVEFWRIFAVVGDKIALDINYSCDVEDKEREERVVEGIIDSIQLIGTGALPADDSEDKLG